METTPDKPKPCPQCNEVLEQGSAVLTSGMIPGAAYRCSACRMLYTPDLQPLARMVG
jgi:uncharacterized protein with PIN domain